MAAGLRNLQAIRGEAQRCAILADCCWYSVFLSSQGRRVADENLEEAQAIQKLELLGARIQKDNALPSGRVIGVDFEGTKGRDKDLILLKSLPNIRRSDSVTSRSRMWACENCMI